LKPRFQRLSVVLAGLLPLAACHGCRSKPREINGLEQLLPRNASALVFVPRLGTALDHLRLLSDALAQIPQGELVGQALDQLAGQLGGGGRLADLPDELGLDRARSMAIVMTKADVAAPELWLALPVKDRGLLASRLGKLTAARFDTHEEGAAHAVRRYVHKDGTLVAALRFDERAGGTALLAFGRQAEGELDAVVGLTAEQSLARSPDYQACRPRWSEMDLWGFVPEGAELHQPSLSFKAARGSGIGVAFGKDGMSTRAVALLTVAQSALASAVSSASGQDLLGLLSPRAPLWFRFGGDLSALAAKSEARSAIPAPIAAALQEAGIDVRAFLSNLEPGIALSVGLLDRPSFRAMPVLDPRESNPFSFLSLRAVGRVRDIAVAKASLQKIEAAGPRFGVTYSASMLGGVPVQTASYSQGESVSLALVGHTLLATGGDGEMQQALAALAAPVNAPPLIPNAVAALRLDVPLLLSEVDAIPGAAFGGFAGLTVRSLISRLAAPLSHFGQVRWALFLDSDAAIAELSIPLR
jgi:hypothetical protein